MNRYPRDGRYTSSDKPERAQDASTAHAKEEIATAISMLERAALEQNHSNAAMQLANLYLDGISPALRRPDPVRAERMLNLAADLGSDRAAKWRASDKGQQLQKALKNSTPLSKGYIGMLLRCCWPWRSFSSCGFAWRLRSWRSVAGRRGSSRSSRLRRTRTISVTSICRA